MVERKREFINNEARWNRVANEIRGDVIGPSIQANSIRGDVNFHIAKTPPKVKPAQLPLSPPHFTGREQELATLERLADEARTHERMLMVVITGQGGVGKTSLSLRWLHQVSHQYNSGQLFLDLQGFSGVDIVTPTEALTIFLRALGIAAKDIPTTVEEQAALFRSLTTGQEFIIVLDNAISAAQVRPLLPGHARTIVVVTSRLQLSGLAVDGATFMHLDPFSEEAALDLLAHMLSSERTTAEPRQARLLTSLCGRLPLALCTAAARLAVRRGRSIGSMVAELTDERRRLAALNLSDDASVQAVFDTSYSALPPNSARVYRLLALHPGPDFDDTLATAVAQLEDHEANQAIDTLIEANLLEEKTAGRRQFHDLLRLHAKSLAQRIESSESYNSAQRRIVGHYLRWASAADRRIIPGRSRLGTQFAPGEKTPQFDRTAALAWLEQELPNLVAVQKLAHERTYHQEAWEICEALWPLFVYRKHYQTWLDTHRTGLEAARACGNQLAEAQILAQLASAYLNLHRFDLAEKFAAQAVDLERANDHALGEAAALERRGVAELAQGRTAEAIATFSSSLMLNERAGVQRGVAIMSRRLGDAFHAVDEPDKSISYLSRARAFFAADGDQYNEARTLLSLGRVYADTERIDEAQQALQAVLDISEAIGARNETANAHVALAELAERRGRMSEQRAHLEAALVILEAQEAPQAEEIRRSLAHLIGD